MKKYFFIILFFFLIFPLSVFANSNSIDLEAGSSQYLSITDGSQTGLDLSSALTLEAWVKLESQPATNANFLFISKDGTASDVNRGYSFSYNNISDTYYLRLFVSEATDVSDYDTLQVVSPLSTDTWTHVAVSWLASTKTAKFYVNGSQVGSDAVGSNVSSLYNNATPFTIGAWTFNNPYSYFDGLMDEARVWSDVRTESEIADNMEVDISSSEAGLVSYWKFEDNLLDENANNNNLSNNGTATFSTDVPFGEETPPEATATSTLYYHQLFDSGTNLKDIAVWQSLIFSYFGITFYGFLFFGVIWIWHKMFDNLK